MRVCVCEGGGRSSLNMKLMVVVMVNKRGGEGGGVRGRKG